MSNEHSHYVDDCHFLGLNLNITPGMVIVLVTDKGPSGPCGQSMSVTSQHANLHLFKDRETAAKFMKENRSHRGRNQDIRMLVAGEGGDHLCVTIH